MLKTNFFLFTIVLFCTGCSANVMHNYIVDDKHKSHVYLSESIYNNSTHWCFKHNRMENIKIKNPIGLKSGNIIND